MTEPAGDMAAGAAGGGRLRASHADREQVIDVLKAAFVQARLTKDEFDSRITQALASRTYAELAVVTAGIPAAPSGVQPSRYPVRARVRHRVNPDLRSDVRVVVAACPIAAVSWLATVPAGDNFVTMPLLLLVAFTATVAALRSFVRGAIVLVESWLQKRPGWQPVPPPEPGEWLLNIKAGRLVPCLVASILCCRKNGDVFSDIQHLWCWLPGPEVAVSSSRRESVGRGRYRGHRTAAEPLALVLRPGNAGSNTAADHIEAARLALAELPRHPRSKALLSRAAVAVTAAFAHPKRSDRRYRVSQ